MTTFEFMCRGEDLVTTVHFGRGLLARPLDGVIGRKPGVMVVDAGVAGREWMPRLAAELLFPFSPPVVLPGGESSKEPPRLIGLWEEFAARGLDRDARVVVVGGGAVLDAAAFAAATWLRGVETVLVPTTLLSQVDAALGGKSAINLKGAKNQAGVIAPARHLLIDPAVAMTVAEREWRSGVGEIVKMALLEGGALFDRVRASGRLDPESEALDGLIEGTLRAKARHVAADPFERGPRKLLNLGHTVGHVLEGLSHAGSNPWPHGLCVAAGILAESRAFGSSQEVVGAALELLSAQELPATVPVAFDARCAAELLFRDKKRREGSFVVPVLESVGTAVLRGVESASLLAAVESAASGPTR